MATFRTEPERRLDPEAVIDQEPDQIMTALRHPVRRRILRRLHTAGEAQSPRELADLLGCDLAEIARHVAILEEVNAVGLTDVIAHRGATEHFYASTVEGDGGFCLVLIATQWHDEGQ